MTNSKQNQPVCRLEYNEAQGNFHFNFHFKLLSYPKHEPDTFRWATIAEQVAIEDAGRFIYILNNLKIEFGVGNMPLNIVRLLWYVFSNAHLDLQSLRDKAQKLDPERFE